MPQLDWDESDFISCLQVLPEVADYETSHLFRIEKNGLRLELRIKQFESNIFIRLYQDGADKPVVAFKIIDCGGTRYVNDKRGEYLEFAPSRLSDNSYSKGMPIPMGVRLSIKPSIQIEIFDDSWAQ